MTMNKKEIRDKIQDYINGRQSYLDLEIPDKEDELTAFYYRTAKRLRIAFDLQSRDECYYNDFLIALRDFLLVFELGMTIENIEISNQNEYAIKKNELTGEYFATFQFPEGVSVEFAEKAFMRNLPTEKNEKKSYNLMTDSMIFSRTGFRRFKSLPQKLAVYGALNTPNGYTTLVSLPTGGGKSLITQMLAYQSDGLTVVVVPTVSLADDQLIAARQIIKTDSVDREIFAYRSGVEIAPILSAIQNRTAKLLFISPEALMNNPAFENAMTTANKQHYLKNIVIDEAHIVVDWGASFRVDYQCLEAWRKKLMLTNPSIRTVLLSATFEKKCIDVLKKLFSDGERWIEIRCDALRHEPRYILLKERSYGKKDKKTIELVQKLPHPMIVYVARPDDAERIKSLLGEHGINNVQTYTGLTKNDQREKLLKSWKANEFEIMVATSAFGVGVDKLDVRTVIHLYIPQNPNAYYQELGRGGRDQLPCLSVMCTYPDDLNIAFQRISKKVMTTDKIIGRWDSMYNNKASIRSGNIIHINTAIKPNYHAKDEWDDTPTSDADMNWNIYVLLLFRRYGLIDIVSITNDNGLYTFSIEIKNDILRKTGSGQKDFVGKLRTEEWDYYNDAYKIMEAAVKDSQKSCWSEMFFETYDKVNEYCAGCNAHSEINNGDINAFPLKQSVRGPVRNVLADQKTIFEGQEELVVIAKKHEKLNVIKRLDQVRMFCMIVSDEMLEAIHYYDNMPSGKNTYIVGPIGAKELLKKGDYYYISGLVAIIYPEDEKEILEIYKMATQYLCHKSGIHVVHVLTENIYIPSVGKNITDLIEGRVVTAEMLCN